MTKYDVKNYLEQIYKVKLHILLGAPTYISLNAGMSFSKSKILNSIHLKWIILSRNILKILLMWSYEILNIAQTLKLLYWISLIPILFIFFLILSFEYPCYILNFLGCWLAVRFFSIDSLIGCILITFLDINVTLN